MNSITIKAPAKLNLSLDITGLRENDGYHLLASIMQTVDIYDTVILEKSDKISLECACPGIPADGGNLAVKAAAAFFGYTGLDAGVHIKLEKQIPHGAGLGGGSADAAAVLKGLDRLYETRLDTCELYDIGINLGADVPFCLHGGTALVTGIGENIVALKGLFECYFIVVKPDFSISTQQAYQSYDLAEQIDRPDNNGMVKALYEDDLTAFCANMGNVLEAAVKEPQIQQIKDAMKQQGALASRMTGSGSAVFGIFADEDSAHLCAEAMEAKYPHVYLCMPCK